MTSSPKSSIEQLIVVAGPTAVGKSTLLLRLAEDDLLRKRFGVPVDAPARTGGALALDPLSGHIDHLVMHYDIFRPLHQHIPAYASDPGLAALRHADRIAFFTLRTTREHLCNQLDLRIARFKKKPKKRFLKLRSLYDTDALAETYDRWLSFVALFADVTVGNHFVEVHDGYELIPVETDGAVPTATNGPGRTV